MGRIANGSTLSVRNLPSPVIQEVGEKELPPHYLEWLNTRMLRAQNGIARYFADLSRSVEEYQGVSEEGPEGTVTLTVIPDYEPAPECITSVLVTGPVNTPFTLQLGDRFMTLATDANGKCLLAPVFIKLHPTSKRLLIAGTPGLTVSPSGLVDTNITGAIVAATGGNVVLPASGVFNSYLIGFDVSLSTVGTAPMTITVSNVPGGPFTYTIPTGSQSLSIRYPAPVPGSGGNPTVAWAATAAAVGNVTAYGERLNTAGGGQVSGSWMLQMSGYALKANEA